MVPLVVVLDVLVLLFPVVVPDPVVELVVVVVLEPDVLFECVCEPVVVFELLVVVVPEPVVLVVVDEVLELFVVAALLVLVPMLLGPVLLPGVPVPLELLWPELELPWPELAVAVLEEASISMQPASPTKANIDATPSRTCRMESPSSVGRDREGRCPRFKARCFSQAL